MTSPHEQNARERKAGHMAALIWAALSDAERRNAQLPWQTSQQPDEWWTALSVQAGHPNQAPSDATREMIAEKLSVLVNAERRGATDPCTGDDLPCQDGMVYWRLCHHSSPCPCAYGEDVCPRCDGSGQEPCEMCGHEDHPATVVVPTGHACASCAAEEWARIARQAGYAADPFSALAPAARSA